MTTNCGNSSNNDDDAAAVGSKDDNADARYAFFFLAFFLHSTNDFIYTNRLPYEPLAAAWASVTTTMIVTTNVAPNYNKWGPSVSRAPDFPFSFLLY